MIPFFISLGTCSHLFGALVAPVCFESILASLSVAEFQTTGTGLHAQRAYSDTSSSAATELGSIASFLLHSSLQPSSIPTYQCAWKLFHKFYDSTFYHPFHALLISPSILALFVAYLFYSRYTPSTVMTCVMFGLLP